MHVQQLQRSIGASTHRFHASPKSMQISAVGTCTMLSLRTIASHRQMFLLGAGAEQ